MLGNFGQALLRLFPNAHVADCLSSCMALGAVLARAVSFRRLLQKQHASYLFVDMVGYKGDNSFEGAYMADKFGSQTAEMEGRNVEFVLWPALIKVTNDDGEKVSTWSIRSRRQTKDVVTTLELERRHHTGRALPNNRGKQRRRSHGEPLTLFHAKQFDVVHGYPIGSLLPAPILIFMNHWAL
ncbi:hypothetical protein MRB53_040364 [Persea americana]|nr:hypothetical protein MRB53_040364 [Persea americana]